MPLTQIHTARVLVTGATGFLGTAIAHALERTGYAVVRGGRLSSSQIPRPGVWVQYGEVGPDTEWGRALQGVTTIVHLGGVAHDMSSSKERACHLFDRVNVRGTERLASAAAAHGVRRFVLMSSALVHGARSFGRPLSEDDAVSPINAYAQSKLRSEEGLKEVAGSAGMEFVILRPPMVYGPNARGNFNRLVRLVRSGMPLPFGAARAPRSFIGIDNLADAVVQCLQHPLAAGETFLVCDQTTSSTADLVKRIAATLGRGIINLQVPPSFVKAGLRGLGRERDFERLFEPFELDSGRIRARLGWHPPVSLAEGIRSALQT